MDLLSGARSPSWRYLLLNERDEPMFELDGVEAGSYEIAAQSPLGVSGSVTMVGRGQSIDFMRDRIQIVYDPGVRGVDAWPVATMILTTPTDEHSSTAVTWNISLLSKLTVLADDTVERYSLPAGTPIVGTVEGLIRSAGEDRIAVTPSSLTLRSPLSFDPGTSKLTIINELLQAAGYWSLWCDGAGQFRVEPYVEPERRPIVREFVQGSDSIHSAVWSREQDLSGVPNRVKVATEGDDETLPLVGTAWNENPDSQFSFQARGNRWIDREIETVEASSQAVVDSIAAQRLRDAMDPVARYEVTHWLVPLDPNDAVLFVSGDTSVRATVQRMSVNCDSASLVEATWREVVPV